MTQEDKELLLKDLSARLYYRPTVLLSGREHCILCGIDGDEVYLNVDSDSFHIENIKPYLRPMSSMTEEEKKDLLVTTVGNEGSKYFRVLQDGSIDNTDATIQDLNKFNMHWVNFDKDTVTLYLDWLNAHHFDYKGLIEKGLALKAPEGMYNTNNE